MKDNLLLKFSHDWEGLIKSPANVLVAVSTGVDSMVLCDLLLHLPLKIRPEVSVAYVDHQLRKQSVEETAFIKDYCQKKHLPLYHYTWPKKDHPQTGMEEQARRMRYAFFEKVMLQNKLPYLLTAHHANDQAETILMKEIRGGDLKQLQGILPKRPFAQGFLLRPLLNFSKAEILAYAKQHQIQYFEDETNQQDDILRNRIRHHIIPQFEQENPLFLQHMQDFSEQLQDLFVVAAVSVAKVKNDLKNGTGYDLAGWLNIEPYMQRILLKDLLAKNGTFSKKQADQCLKLLLNPKKPQAQIALGSDYFFVKSYRSFKIEQKKPQAENISDKPLKLAVGKWYSLDNGARLGVFLKDKVELLSSDDVLESANPHFWLRHRQNGDMMRFAAYHQKVKKILIDQKIATERRKQLWLLVNDQGEVVWIIGVKKSDLSQASLNDKMQYIVVFRNNGRKEV